MRELSGKVAVVTGAASGMGRAIVERLATEGMKVVLADVEREPLEAAAAALRDSGFEAIGVQTDVSNAESVEALAQRAIDEFGAVHLVHNNAGVGGTGQMAWEQPFSAWEWMLRVNYLGVVHGIRTFVPRLVEQGEGHVINTSSMAGLFPGVGSTPYTASKYAVSGLSEALKLELELIGSPVKVSVLIPGPVKTGISKALRNWPAELGPVPEARQSDRLGVMPIPPVLKNALEDFMQPPEVAKIFLEGVRADRFWIVTHPEETAHLFKARAEALLRDIELGTR